MRGLGLLVGSATGGLAGVDRDIQVMEVWLQRAGFALDVRMGPDATREGVVEGIARLKGSIRPGAPAVIYYSGHGGHVPVPRAPHLLLGAVPPRAFHYLVPTDHRRGVEFRGIFRTELSLAVQELSERTSNITVILDCCHSADGVRQPEATLKSICEPWSEGVEAHLAWLHAQGYELERLPMLRNRSMVLLAACGANQKAFEYTRPDGTCGGLFTDKLISVLDLVGVSNETTWDDLMRRVCQETLKTRWYQRPQVSGPSSRYPFSERQRRRLGALTLERDGPWWRLSGGQAAGVEPGDRYRIFDPITGSEDQGAVDAIVATVHSHVSVLGPSLDHEESLREGMVAVPRPGGPARVRCGIRGYGPLATNLAGRLTELEGLELVRSDQTEDLAFMLDVDDGRVVVRDASGRRLRWPWRNVSTGGDEIQSERMDGLIEDLRGLTRGTALVQFARGRPSTSAVESLAHRAEWGIVQGRGLRVLEERGAVLSVGDRIYITVENRAVRPLFVSIFDVGVGRAVTLLSCNEPEGIDLGVREIEVVGAREMEPLRGLELDWPADVPADGPVEESLVIFISNGPLPVRSWETSPWSDRVSSNRTSTSQGAGRRAPDYVIKHFCFELCPNNMRETK